MKNKGDIIIGDFFPHPVKKGQSVFASIYSSQHLKGKYFIKKSPELDAEPQVFDIVAEGDALEVSTLGLVPGKYYAFIQLDNEEIIKPFIITE